MTDGSRARRADLLGSAVAPIRVTERAFGASRKTPRVPTALYPGSFDPLHLGHLSVIQKASTMFDHVVVAVIGNPDKSSGMFTVADRVDLIRAAARSLPNVTCVNHHGLTVDAVQQTGSDVIIRTGHKDKADEWSMLSMNELTAKTRTCLIPPDPAVAFLSSSLVRSLTNLGRVADAIRFVPPPVAQALKTLA